MKALIYLISLLFVGTNQAYAWEAFYVLKPDELRFSKAKSSWSQEATPTDCRARLKEIACIVNPIQDPKESRRCQPGSEAMAPALERIYDVIPAKLQQTFCTMKVIFIENDTEVLGYAGVLAWDSNSQPQGSFMGLRRALLEQNYDATSVIGWKEQKAFGLTPPPFVHLPEGPRSSIVLPNSLSALHYVIVHEIGHILDFSNKANDFICPAGEACAPVNNPDDFLKMIPAPNSWTALSWQSPMKPKDLQTFPLWSKLCFYDCKEQLSVADMEDFYRQLAPTDFISTYAAVSPWEDFAESLTFHVMAQHEDFEYQIQTPFASYDLKKKWDGLGIKKIWMQDFLNRDLKYPTPLK
ncbi:hypothetical protein [Bdellovibrio bacteriovorus]|uniref:Uncharacterized protein n=1 Tax=Bdellovibrio bacteriovorus TaxID=959 RepID=A0A1Z3NCG4_BDEBC|nr:hypothetical protein [Bdellovibrio bacteriovorus]ASD65169.1 hypothetical protein B9G79_17135 [Bdellovibrio bacteriovorus]